MFDPRNTTKFCINVDCMDFANRKFPAFAPKKTTLIMIGDPGYEFRLPTVVPDYGFIATFSDGPRTKVEDWGSVHQFEFLDVEEDSHDSINPDQAKELFDAIKQAEEAGRHIVVHCFAGVARSGAVVEFATTKLSFVEDESIYRGPNERVLKMLTDCL